MNMLRYYRWLVIDRHGCIVQKSAIVPATAGDRGTAMADDDGAATAAAGRDRATSVGKTVSQLFGPRIVAAAHACIALAGASLRDRMAFATRRKLNLMRRAALHRTVVRGCGRHPLTRWEST